MNFEELVVGAFHTYVRSTGAYQAILRSSGIDPDSIKTLQDFCTRVPVVDKNALFKPFTLAELCQNGKVDDIISAYTSSGYTGTFSFGVETQREAAITQGMIDRMLVLFGQADRRKTLLINALPAGVRVPNSLTIVMDVGTRSSAAIAGARMIGPAVEQIVISAEQPMLKLIAEEGHAAGVWKGKRVFCVTGAEMMAENFRRYVGGLLGQDPEHPENGRIVLSLGISEVSLSLGLEMDGLYRLRQAFFENKSLAKAVLGEDRFVPTLVMFDPTRFFIETLEMDGLPRMVATSLDPERRIPLIRYCTGDWAKVFWPQELAAMLKAAGREDLIAPDMIGPVLALFGRGRGIELPGRKILAEQIKECVYEDPELAAATTGNFHAYRLVDDLDLEVQLQPDAPMPHNAASRMEMIIWKRCGIKSSVKWLKYNEMGHGMELSYQRKFRYV